MPNSGYWRVLVVAIRSPETELAAAKTAFRPGAANVGFL